MPVGSARGGLSRQQQAAAVAPDPVIAAAGDIACPPPGTATVKACHQAATADLLVNGGYSAVLPIGDPQYNCGELSAFNAVYDPTWGRVKSITKPVVGDNEYVGSTCSTPGSVLVIRLAGVLPQLRTLPALAGRH